MLNAAVNKTNNGFNLNNEFAALANKTVEYAIIAGSRLIPFSSPSMPFFNKLNHIDKLKVISELKSFNEICEQILSEGKALTDAKAMTWYALRKFNLHFPSDLFDFINDENVIEIYNRDNIQIFRNFNFFDVTSYTLEDLLCRPWVDLFSRLNSEHTMSIINTCNKFYSKELTAVTPLSHVGKHKIVETDSPFGLNVDAVVDFVAPIYDKTKYPAGFIAIETAQLTSVLPQGIVAEQLLKKYYLRDIDL